MLRTTVLFGALAAATAFSPALPTGGREYHNNADLMSVSIAPT
jgi:hypothetical protein